jgi:hypothetical protein
MQRILFSEVGCCNIPDYAQNADGPHTLLTCGYVNTLVKHHYQHSGDHEGQICHYAHCESKHEAFGFTPALV